MMKASYNIIPPAIKFSDEHRQLSDIVSVIIIRHIIKG